MFLMVSASGAEILEYAERHGLRRYPVAYVPLKRWFLDDDGMSYAARITWGAFGSETIVERTSEIGPCARKT